MGLIGGFKTDTDPFNVSEEFKTDEGYRHRCYDCGEYFYSPNQRKSDNLCTPCIIETISLYESILKERNHD